MRSSNSFTSDGDQANIELSLARLVQEEAEREYLQKYAAEIDSASNSEKRRIRREARGAGLDAYIDTIERIVETNEAEKTSLQTMLQVAGSDTIALRRYACRLGIPLPFL